MCEVCTEQALLTHRGPCSEAELGWVRVEPLGKGQGQAGHQVKLDAPVFPLEDLVAQVLGNPERRWEEGCCLVGTPCGREDCQMPLHVHNPHSKGCHLLGPGLVWGTLPEHYGPHS